VLTKRKEKKESKKERKEKESMLYFEVYRQPSVSLTSANHAWKVFFKMSVLNMYRSFSPHYSLNNAT
jgi:hypothetical protein